jgi:hypothetical protein
MKIGTAVIAVLTGLLVTGCGGYQSDENGVFINPNGKTPPPLEERPYGVFNEYEYQYHDDDYEIEEGINTP